MVGKEKAVLSAFIDDWSRAVPGWRWGYREDTVRLEAALRRGLESASVPSAVFADYADVVVMPMSGRRTGFPSGVLP